MYIVLIGWLYVIAMMAATAKTITSGMALLAAWGVAPALLLGWMLGANRRRRRRSALGDQHLHQPDGADAGGD